MFVDVQSKVDDSCTTMSYRNLILDQGYAESWEWRKGRLATCHNLTFTNCQEWWQWLHGEQDKRRSLWVVMHSAGHVFTMLRGWELIESGDYSFRKPGGVYADRANGQQKQAKDWVGRICIDGVPWHLETQGKVGRVNFSDLRNYYNSSLPSGLSLQQRVEHIRSRYMSLCKRWEDEDNGNWQFSAPALAWSHYRHKHYNTTVVAHKHSEARQLEWECYYPGECRAYYRGECPRPVVQVDVNSLYPSVMSGHDYPVELIDYIIKPNMGIVEDLLKHFGVCADVELDTKYDWFPVKKQGRIIYPVGNYRTSLCGPDFKLAFGVGAITRIHRVAYYKMGRLFDSYVDTWYKCKQTARTNCDSEGEIFAKLMLNGLYGKFAQRAPIWVVDNRVDVVQPWTRFAWEDTETRHVWPARSIGWIGQICQARRDCEHTFPAISAYVTAYARRHMHDVRDAIGGRYVYYQDTDGLVVDSDGFRNYSVGTETDSSKLGCLRICGEHSYAAIRGPKNYTLGDRHVISGVGPTDEQYAPMRWRGTRAEGVGPIVCRQPDGRVRTWTTEYETPGTCLEAGYDDDGWYYPLELP